MLKQEENFAKLVEASLAEMQDREAVHYKLKNGEEVSFSANDIIKGINEFGDMLSSMGLKEGDRILIASKVSPYYLIALLGAAKIGIVPMMIDHNILAPEVEEILVLGEIKAVFAMDFFMERIPEKYYKLIPVVDMTHGFELNKSAVKRVSDQLPATTNIHPEVAFILFSSGTTSKRKGVEITHQSEILALKDAASKVYIKDYESNMLAVLPFSHIAGLTTALSTPYYKSTLFMLEDVTAVKIANAFQEYDIQYMGIIPKIYEGFMNKTKEAIKSKGKLVSGVMFKLMDINLFFRKRFNLNICKRLLFPIRKQIFGKKLEYSCAGGTALPKEVMDFYTSLGYTLVNVYASTETSVNMITTDWKHYDSSTTGKPLNDYVDVKVINCDAEGVGELVVKSPGLFYGYFKDEEATRMAYTEDGYFKTGDLAKMTEDKTVTIVGRRKEAILLANGEKVSPDLVENSYAKIMGDFKYAVCGIQLDKKNEFDTVFMFIEGDFSEKDKADIKQKLFFENGQISENYRVSEIRFIKELPKTSVGKIKRFELKDIVLKEEQNNKTSSQNKTTKKIVEDTSLEGKVRACIRKNSKLDLSEVKISGEMNLYNDLGYDSLSLFQLSTDIENVFKKDISEHFTAELTVKDIIDLLELKPHKKVELEYTYDVRDYPQKRESKDEKMFMRLAKMFYLLYRTEYVNWENVPSDKPVILCPNHTSEVDPMVLCFGINPEYRKRLFCICWDKFTATKKGRYFMKLLNAIPIDRRSVGNPAATLKVGTECLLNNKSLVIFPEGTRTYDGTLGTFQNGAACIAQACNVPIVPVAMIGMYDAFAKTRKRYRLFKNGKRIKLKIVFNEPIYGDNLTTDEFTEKVKQSINKTLFKYL